MNEYKEQGHKGFDEGVENGFSRGINFVFKLGCIVYLIMLGTLILLNFTGVIE